VSDAPLDPGNTLRIERSEPIVAGTPVTVRLAGHAARTIRIRA
jgi:hypothetical protein